jgi:hypothetical protein
MIVHLESLYGGSLTAAVLAGGRTADPEAIACGKGGAWQQEWLGNI